MIFPSVSKGGGERTLPCSEDGNPSENKCLMTAARGGGRDNMTNVVKCNSLPSLLDDHDARSSPGAHFTSLTPTVYAPTGGPLQRCWPQQGHSAPPPLASLPSLLENDTSESRGKRFFRSRGGGDGHPGPERTLRRSADNIHAEATYVRSFEDYIAGRRGDDRPADRAEMNGVPKPQISARPFSVVKRGPPVPPKPSKITRKGNVSKRQLDGGQKDARAADSARNSEASSSKIDRVHAQQGVDACSDVAQPQTKRSGEESTESRSSDASNRTTTGQENEMSLSFRANSRSQRSRQDDDDGDDDDEGGAITPPASLDSDPKSPSSVEGGGDSATRTRRDTMLPAAASVTAGRSRDRPLSRTRGSPTRSASATDLRSQEMLGGGRTQTHSRAPQQAGGWPCALAGGHGAVRTEGDRERAFERTGKSMSVSNENVNSLQVGKDLLYKKSFGISLTDIVSDKTIFPLGIQQPQPLTSSGSEDSQGGFGDWSLGSTDSLRPKGDGSGARRSGRSGIITTPRLSRKALGPGENKTSACGDSKGHKKSSKMHRPLMPITVPRIKKGTRRPSFRAVQDR